jgi:hypothetical protein
MHFWRGLEEMNLVFFSQGGAWVEPSQKRESWFSKWPAEGHYGGHPQNQQLALVWFIPSVVMFLLIYFVQQMLHCKKPKLWVSRAS